MNIDRKAGPYGLDKITFQASGIVIYRGRNGLFDSNGQQTTIPDVSATLSSCQKQMKSTKA